MTVTDEQLATVEASIPRDRWGRPLIVPELGGKARPYTRATTLAGVLEDLYNLQLWQQRMVIIGLVDRPDLLLSAAAHREDKHELNKIAEQAIEAAKAHANATIGTALHALTEQIDRGQEVASVPGEYRRDLDAYALATKRLRVIEIERFLVLDDLQVAGTADRVVEYEGERYIADIKTGSIEYGSGKIAMQLALYSRGRMYDPSTHERTPLPGVNGQRGIVIHLPAGQARCQLKWVNIGDGWESVRIADECRAWRKRRDWIEEFDEDGAIANLIDAGLISDPILAEIGAASVVEQLTAIWRKHEQQWTPEHTAAAAARKQALGGKA